MTDEIFKVMKHFNGSYINQCGELILSDRGNVFFTATNCETKEDVICKLLEWCSRPIAKGMPYSTYKRNYCLKHLFPPSPLNGNLFYIL